MDKEQLLRFLILKIVMIRLRYEDGAGIHRVKKDLLEQEVQTNLHHHFKIYLDTIPSLREIAEIIPKATGSLLVIVNSPFTEEKGQKFYQLKSRFCSVAVSDFGKLLDAIDLLSQFIRSDTFEEMENEQKKNICKGITLLVTDAMNQVVEKSKSK